MFHHRAPQEFYEVDKVGQVPLGWTLEPLTKCFDFFPTATLSREKTMPDEDVGYIHYGDIHTRFNQILDLGTTSLPCVNNEVASKFTLVENGDLVLADASEDYEGVGKCIEIRNDGNKKAIAGLHTLHLRAKPNTFVKGFSRYLLESSVVRLQILRSATGIKVYSISKSSLKGVLIPRPPIEEQKSIIAVLEKVDALIRAINETILASEKLRNALIQNLLSGELRPDGKVRTSNEFYHYEGYGKLPIGWRAPMIKDVTVNHDSKRRPIKAEDRQERKGIYPYYGAAGIIDHIDGFLFDGKYILFGEDGENLVSRKLPQAFVVEGQFWVNNHAHILEAKPEVDVDFLCYQLENRDYRNIVYGSAQPKINKSDLNRIRVSLPDDKSEQKAIADRIKEAESVINSRRIKISQLERLRLALSENLLSGSVTFENSKNLQEMI